MAGQKPLLRFVARLSGRQRRHDEQFQNYAFRSDNFFEQQLKAGCTIQTARLEKGGLDEDEGQLVFELEPDWGA